MKYIASSKYSKLFIGLFVGVALLASGVPARAASLSSAQIQAVVQLLQSFNVDSGTINNVATTLGGGTSGIIVSPPAPMFCPALSYNLYLGLSDVNTAGQVSQLQRYLNVNPTGYFGLQTRAAVSSLQSQNGVYPVTGGVGPLTRTLIQRLCGGQNIYPVNSVLSITNVSGPNSLAVGQQGTWSITTNASYGSYVSTSVRWGDENGYVYPTASVPAIVSQQNTLSHAYVSPGTYTITFTTSDTSGHSNSATASVVVGGVSTQAPTVSSLVPTSGAVGSVVTVYGGGFTGDNTIHFGNGGAMHVFSADGRTLTFTIPTRVGPCSYAGDTSPIRCFVADALVVPGVYNISVSNANGQSNALQFTVTGAQQVGGLSVMQPAAGQVYTRGQDMPMSWGYPVTPGSTSVVLDLYTATGSKVGTIAVVGNTSGSYMWHIPGFPQNYMCTMQYPNGLCGVSIPTGQYYIQATATSDGFNLTSANTYATGQSGIFTINQQ